MPKNQFSLSVEKGEVSKEEGFFFLAAPFEMTVADKTYRCVFEGNDHKEAEFRIYLGDDMLLSLEHPFYLPDDEPDVFFKGRDHKQALACGLHAFLKLEIAKGSRYADYFSKTASELNYSLIQPEFYRAKASK